MGTDPSLEEAPSVLTGVSPEGEVPSVVAGGQSGESESLPHS